MDIFSAQAMAVDRCDMYDMQYLPSRPREMELRLVYLSEDLIDCKFGRMRKKRPDEWTLKENLLSGDEALKTKFNLVNPRFSFRMSISLCLKETNEDSIPTSIARSFNDQASSDFIVKCQDKEFYVHKYILKQQSEYFDRLLNNNFVERENNFVAIDDFEPEIVEILLRYLYTGVVCLPGQGIRDVIRIIDKYNFIQALDTIDTFLAQEILWRLNIVIKSNEEKLSDFEKLVNRAEKSKLPKLATMLVLWKNSNQSEISDEKWSKLIRDNPNFYMLAEKTSEKKDYQSWVEQHKKWFFRSFCAKPFVKWRVNDKTAIATSTLIVGTRGEMKGAVKCSPIL